MNLILLPGNNPEHNRNWIQLISFALKEYFDVIQIQEYRHWELTGGLPDVEHEVLTLNQAAVVMGDYVIFGKSAGALIALDAIYQHKVNPQKCIFIGLAVHFAEQNSLQIHTWLQNYSIPTLFIQKTGDWAASFAELEKILQERNVQNYQLLEIPGEDHEYNEVELIREKVATFLAA